MTANDIEFGMHVTFRDDPTVFEVECVGLYFPDMVTCKLPGDRIALYTFVAKDLRPVLEEGDRG